MNKERARELLKTLKEYYTKIMPNVIPLQREDEKGKNELIQALDIAIESLDNEWVDVRDRLPSDSGMYLVTTVTYKGTLTKISGYKENLTKKTSWFLERDYSENKVIAWKKVEPYERKE